MCPEQTCNFLNSPGGCSISTWSGVIELCSPQKVDFMVDFILPLGRCNWSATSTSKPQLEFSLAFIANVICCLFYLRLPVAVVCGQTRRPVPYCKNLSGTWNCSRG